MLFFHFRYTDVDHCTGFSTSTSTVGQPCFGLNTWVGWILHPRTSSFGPRWWSVAGHVHFHTSFALDSGVNHAQVRKAVIWEPAHNCEVLADIQRFWQYRFQCGTFGSRSQLFHRLLFSSLCRQLAHQLNWEGQRSSSLRECCRDQSSKIIRCYITVCHILRGTEAIQLGSIALALCGEKVINIIMFWVFFCRFLDWSHTVWLNGLRVRTQAECLANYHKS